MLAMSNKSRGFTIVELLVVMTVLGILSLLVFSTLGDLYSANLTSLGVTTQDTDTRGALRQIEGEIADSSGFYDTATVPTPTGPTSTNNTWNYAYNDSSKPDNMVLIVGSYATNPANDMLAFTQSISGSCTIGEASPATLLLVYFVKQDAQGGQYNLYRRTIVNPSGGSLCSGTSQRTTCSQGTSAPLCAGSDAILVRNVSALKLDFYKNPTDTTPVTGADIQTARTVTITVTTNQRTNGQPTQSQSSLKVSTIFQK